MKVYPVGIIIGIDYYLLIINNQNIKTKEGPIASDKKKTLWPLFMDGVQLPQG